MKSSQTNTFTGGMQKDLHPMTTPNNVLTDALNATITTMNGNESVLQNDMGNARVESAYLPEGYIPIGMKEYGGVIYIASYNPITKKGQVGSFPSPERNKETDNDNNLKWNLDQLLIKNSNGEVIQYSIKDSIYQDKVFHPGDKFILQADLNNLNGITITDQLHEGNGDISLKLSVIDSNNTLVDITEIMNKYNLNGQLDPKGCIIYNITGNSVDDARIENYNVYNSKIAGKLYLVSELNSIKSINAELDTDLNDNNTVDLKTTITYKYNCKRSNILPPLIYVNDTVYNKDTLYTISNTNNKDKSGINYHTEVYTITVPKTTGISTIKIIPRMRLFDGSINVMHSLASIKAINMDNIDTDKCDISDWRYYVVDNKINLVWGLETYPKKSNPITGIKFKFTDILQPDPNGIEKTITGYKSYFGTFTYDINFFLNKSTIYKVELYRMGQNNSETLIGHRYILTTPLLNKCFFQDTADYIQDYSELTEEKYPKLFKELNTITISGDLDVQLLNQTRPNVKTDNYKPISPTEITDSQTLNRVTKKNSDYLVHFEPTIINEENYPCTLNRDGVSISNKNISLNNANTSTQEPYNIEVSDQDSNDNNYIKYIYSDQHGLNFKLALDQKYSATLTGKYVKKDNILVKNMFEQMTLKDLTGYSDENDSRFNWLSNVLKVWKDGNKRQATLNFYESTNSNNIKLFEALNYNTSSIGSMIFRELNINDENNTIIYNKLIDYLKTKGNPTIVLWRPIKDRSREGISDGYSTVSKKANISIPDNTILRNSRWQEFDKRIKFKDHEYIWWLNSNGTYSLLNSIYALPEKLLNEFGNPLDGSDNPMPVTNEMHFKNTINTIIDNLYQAKSYQKNLSLYLLNYTNYTNTQDVNIDLDLTINITTNNNILQYNRTAYTLPQLDPQLNIFKFKVETTSNIKKPILLNTNVQGFENILQELNNINSITTIDSLLKRSGVYYIKDLSNNDLDITQLYSIDDNNNIINSKEMYPEIFNVFTYKSIDNVYKLVVNANVTSIKQSDYFFADMSGTDNQYLIYKYNFANMPSFNNPKPPSLEVNISNISV